MALQAGPRVKPWPGHFLVRTTGEVVPLVAVDELPPGINIVGVPRSLDLKDTIGMINLGLQRSCGKSYQITSSQRIITSAGVDRERKIASTVDQYSSQASSTISENTSPITAPRSPSYIDSPPTQINSAVSTQTQLCRHWCRHGICKWGQQCRYCHVMPMTRVGLQEVGLTDWPSWYRDLHPSSFLSDIQVSQGGSRSNRKSRAHLTYKAGSTGCCHTHESMTAVSKGERLRGGVRVLVKEQGPGKIMRNVELGEQIILRLKTMEQESEAKLGKANSSILTTTSAISNTRKWEHESEDEDERVSEAEIGEGVKKEILVDV